MSRDTPLASPRYVYMANCLCLLDGGDLNSPNFHNELWDFVSSPR